MGLLSILLNAEEGKTAIETTLEFNTAILKKTKRCISNQRKS
jgi:hypothetical protein